jgi:hypothetical protein
MTRDKTFSRGFSRGLPCEFMNPGAATLEKGISARSIGFDFFIRHYFPSKCSLSQDASLRFRALPSRCLRTSTIPQAEPTLTPQMKSVGEAMAIGCTF